MRGNFDLKPDQSTLQFIYETIFGPSQEMMNFEKELVKHKRLKSLGKNWNKFKLGSTISQDLENLYGF